MSQISDLFFTCQCGTINLICSDVNIMSQISDMIFMWQKSCHWCSCFVNNYDANLGLWCDFHLCDVKITSQITVFFCSGSIQWENKKWWVMEIDLNYLQNGVLLSLCIRDDYNRFIWNVACHAMVVRLILIVNDELAIDIVCFQGKKGYSFLYVVTNIIHSLGFFFCDFWASQNSFPPGLFLWFIEEGFCHACPKISWSLCQMNGSDGTLLALETHALTGFSMPCVFSLWDLLHILPWMPSMMTL